MEQPVAVLKQHEVRMGGVTNVGQPVPNIKSGTGPRNASPQAKLIQQTGNQALIEVTCGCGRQILLQCELDPVSEAVPAGQPNPSETEQPADA